MDNEKQNTQKEKIQQRMETLGMTIWLLFNYSKSRNGFKKLAGLKLRY